MNDLLSDLDVLFPCKTTFEMLLFLKGNFLILAVFHIKLLSLYKYKCINVNACEIPLNICQYISNTREQM